MIFVKTYFPAGEYFSGGEIEQFVCFLSNGITNEDTGDGTVIEFVRDMDIGSISETTKHTEVRVRRWFQVKVFEWCFEGENG